MILICLVLILASCTERATKLVPKSRIISEEVSQTQADIVSFNPKVDILFVIDNSRSMEQVQNELSKNAYLFSNAISKVSLLDLHVGIVSTDMYNCTNDCGELLGNPKFVTQRTKNLADVLAKKILIGTSGWGGEEMFSPVIENLTKITVPANAGFYRQEAFFAVIFITDAKEQSRFSPDEFYNFLVKLKKDANKVLGYGVIRKLADENTCINYSPPEDLDSKLEDFLSRVVNADKKQNNVLSLCSQDYGTKLAEFANDIVKRSSGSLKLNRLPNVKTITVTYGAQVIPNSPTEGWIYEPATNSLIFAAGIVWIQQAAGVGLNINFEAAEL